MLSARFFQQFFPEFGGPSPHKSPQVPNVPTSQRQVLPALVLLGGMLCLPRSPRWLVQQGRSDEAL